MADLPWGPSLRDPDLDRRVLEVFRKFPHDSTIDGLIGHRSMFAMQVDRVLHDQIFGSLCTLHHRVGLQWDGILLAGASIRVPGLNNCYPLVCSGEKILLAGILKSISEDGTTIELQKGATIVHYPELHWNVLHLFSGGYSGWSQAAEWLETADVGFIADRQLFLDWDPTVVKTCALNHSALVVKAPLEPNPDFVTAKKIIVEGSISDFTTLHAVRMPFNLVETLSPPCVSWSKGGTGGGLDSSHGFALLESIEMIFATQPVAFLDETFSIEVGKHQNFRELGAMLFRLPLRLMMQIRVEHFSLQPTPTDLVYDFLSSERECDIFLGGYLLCSIQACEPIPVQHTTENHLNLHGVPTFLQGTSLPFGPFGPEDLLFTQAIENLENLNCTTTYPGSTFVIWAGKDLWAFTPFDELDAATQMGEPVEFVELRVYLHDLLQPAHERDFRSLAVFPIMELMAAKVVVVRADFQGNLIVETVVGPEWEEGGWTLWTLIWKGHMVLLQPPTDFDLTSWLAEERQSTPVLGFNFYWHARHDQPVSAPGKVACRLRKPPRRAGEGWLMSGLVRQHSSLAAVATSYNQMEGSSLAGATTTAGMTKEWIKEALQPVELFSDPPNPTVEEPYNQAYVTEEAEVTNTTEETLDHAYVTEKAEVAEDENQVFEAEGAGDQGFEAEEVNSSNMSWELSDQENGEQHEGVLVAKLIKEVARLQPFVVIWEGPRCAPWERAREGLQANGLQGVVIEFVSTELGEFLARRRRCLTRFEVTEDVVQRWWVMLGTHLKKRGSMCMGLQVLENGPYEQRMEGLRCHPGQLRVLQAREVWICQGRTGSAWDELIRQGRTEKEVAEQGNRATGIQVASGLLVMAGALVEFGEILGEGTKAGAIGNEPYDLSMAKLLAWLRKLGDTFGGDGRAGGGQSTRPVSRLGEALWLSCFDRDLDTEDMPEVTLKEYFGDTSAGGRRPKSTKPAQLPADQHVLLEPRKIPFDGSVQTHVEEWLEENIAGSKATSTLRMYQSAWGKWEAWAARQGWPSCYLNVRGDKLENEDKLLAFLGHLGWLGTTAASIKQALFAVKDGHKRGGAGDPTEGMFRVWMLITSLDRHAERKPRRLGVTPGMLVWVGKSLCNSDLFGEDHGSTRRWCKRPCWWFFMLRAKEYCDSGGVDAHMIIRGMDVRLTKNGQDVKEGANEVTLQFRKTKADQEAFGSCKNHGLDGRDVSLSCTSPGRATTGSPAKVFTGPEAHLPLFRWGNGTTLRRTEVQAVLQKAAKAEGLPEDRFMSHSLRIGGASALFQASVPL
ncbi:unnamed protein product [Durusdinium trenchii]|uniref:Uncharacterized protein n=1 Tax=Durusdinium trenchii TaxID=1381693 RepID=A0ABP0KVX0_9DINO